MFNGHARFYLACAAVLAVLMLVVNVQRAFPTLKQMAIDAVERH